MTVRQDFADAAIGLVAVVAAIGPDAWSKPGLGVWTVRDLAGHASRALLTVESYLRPDPVARPDLPDAVAYFGAAAAQLADPDQVAERGRQAGAALGEDPASAVAEIATRVIALVADAPDDAGVTTPVGSIRLADYLPARTFELAVHSLDLVRAVGGDRPAVLDGPLRASAHLALDLSPTPDGVLLALTGRGGLPSGFSVV